MPTDAQRRTNLRTAWALAVLFGAGFVVRVVLFGA
jgi:hypothetical protein